MDDELTTVRFSDTPFVSSTVDYGSRVDADSEPFDLTNFRIDEERGNG